MSSLLDVCSTMVEESICPGLLCREMTAADRERAAQLLADHYKCEKFPLDFLPITGVVVEYSGMIVCVIPVYLESSSKVAVLGHFIANDHIDRRLLRNAAALAIRETKSFARRAGKVYVMSVFGRHSINRIADRLGFVTADQIEEKFCYIGGK
ncbi:MAG: hypothetical protein IJY46_07765 [Lentisphaeria bacterium]|nr:hypothetical protein [Lentisphaeria bacterium]